MPLVHRWCPSISDTPNDLEGSNNGTYNGGMGTTSIGGAGGSFAYEFAGDNNDQITYSSTYGIGAMTVCGWVYPHVVNVTQNLYMCRVGGSDRWAINVNASALIIAGIYDGTNRGKRSVGSSISVNTWYWLCMTFDGSTTVKFYLNNVEQATNANPNIGGPFAGLVASGRPSAAGTDDFDGYLDDWQIWDEVIDSAQRATIYNSGSGRAVDLGGGGPTTGTHYYRQIHAAVAT